MSRSGWTSPGAITDAWSIYRVERPAEQYILDAATPVRSEDTKTKSSILTLDLGQNGLPHTRVRLEVDNSNFHRGVEIGVIKHNEWRIATEFQRQLFNRWCALLHEHTAHFG